MSQFDEVTIAEEREKTYRFLSGLCLNPPSDVLIAMIKNRSIMSLFEDDGESRSWEEMAKFVALSSQIDDMSDELAAERTALFVLPSSHLPHEAVYLDKDKRLGGRVTISVGQFYEKAGADVLDSCIEMPDHIGMELEFMAFLCKMEKDMRESGDHAGLNNCIHLQKKFLDAHLLKWVYQCCEKIAERAKYGFYKAVAYLIIEFVKSEEEYVEELYAGTDAGYRLHDAAL